MSPLTVWKDDFLGIIGPNGGGKNNTAEGDPGITSAGIRCDTFFIRMGLKFLLYGLVICLN